MMPTSVFTPTGDKGVIICLYVDDMLIFSIDIEQVDNTKGFFCPKTSI